MSSLDQIELSTLAQTAGALARMVGARIRSLREQGVAVADTKSSLTDVVTAADREAERLVAEALREARPHDGLLGEEGASTAGTTGITWVVDPIDGTVNYLYGLPAYAVSIAATVEHDGRGSTLPAGTMADGRRAVAGAVYVPAFDELFDAHEGGGARVNGRPIRVSEREELSLALVGTGFGYTVERRTEQAEVARRLIPRVRDIRRDGACSLDLCGLASGRLDAYFERGPQAWDLAAGGLVATEAGARLEGLHGRAAGEDLIVAAGPALFGPLHDLLAELRADTDD